MDIFNTTLERLHAEHTISVFTIINKFFDELDDSHKNILIVPHGGALRMIMHYANYSNKFNEEKYKTQNQNVKINNSDIFEWCRNLKVIKSIPI